MDQTQAIQRQFGAAAAAYATSCVHRAGPDLDAMLEAAGPAPGRRVLDLGCGAGHTALAFAARGAEVIGLDLTPAMLAQARRLASERGLGNARFEQGDATRLPFPDASFDCVTSRLSAHHYAQPGAAVAEAARVLRPGGVLLVSDSVSPEDPALDTFLNAFELLRDASHVRNHRVSEWRAMLEACGFAVRVLGSWPVRIDFDDWVRRMATPDLAVAQLRALFAGAGDAARRAFEIAPDAAGFSIPRAVVEGRLGEPSPRAE
jgi:ubiquinone/menaquinone biosynthesis C-methylase UbiE